MTIMDEAHSKPLPVMLMASSTNSNDSIYDGLPKKYDIETGSSQFEEQIKSYEPTNLPLISWDSPTDPENPLNWSASYRWFIISLTSVQISVICGSSMMLTPNIPVIMLEFHNNNPTLATLIVTIGVIGLSVGPQVFAPLSELYGRLIVQHFIIIGSSVGMIAASQMTSLNGLLGMMFVIGVFGGAAITNGGSVVADIIKQERRGAATSVVTFGVLFTVIWGPIIGALVGASWGWRWCFHVLDIVVRKPQVRSKNLCLLYIQLAILIIISFVSCRESYPPIILMRKAAKLRAETGNPDLRSEYDNSVVAFTIFKRALTRSLKIMCFSRLALVLSIHSGISYSFFWILMGTASKTFIDVYQFSHNTVGFVYLGLGIGYCVGCAVFSVVSDRILKRLAKRSRSQKMKPEHRLPLLAFGTIISPIGLIWYGWSIHMRVHWAIPIISLGCLGVGGSMILVSTHILT
jgi:MFS family permease